MPRTTEAVSSDAAGEAEGGGVDESQQLEGEGDIALDDALQFVEVQVGADQFAEQLDIVELVAGDVVALDDVRPLEKKALKKGVAQLFRLQEVRLGLDLFGQKPDLPAPRRGHGRLPALAGGGEKVDLDDVGEVDKRVEAGGEDEVVEGQGVAHPFQLPADSDDPRVGLHRLQDLDDDQPARQFADNLLLQQVLGKVYESLFVAGELVETDEQQAALDDAEGGAVAVGGVISIRPAGAEQQLIGDHPLLGVENRLAGNHKAHGRTRLS